MDGSEHEIENAILHNESILKTRFHEIWSSHSCDVVGCGSWLVCDGDLKPHGLFVPPSIQELDPIHTATLKQSPGAHGSQPATTSFVPNIAMGSKVQLSVQKTSQ